MKSIIVLVHLYKRLPTWSSDFTEWLWVPIWLWIFRVYEEKKDGSVSNTCITIF